MTPPDGGGETVYTDEERDFILAVERYQRVNRRPFPTFREVLYVALSLGYRKVAEPTEPPKFRGKI